MRAAVSRKPRRAFRRSGRPVRGSLMRRELTEEDLQRGDALKILDRRYGLDAPEARARMDYYGLQMDISQHLYDLREAAGLTYEQLGTMIGATAADVESVEEADFEGDAFTLLWKAARALGKRMEVRVVNATREPEEQQPGEAERASELVAAP